MGLKKNISIRRALQHVVDNPVLESDELISLPVHELVARTLFEIANSANPGNRGSMGRANVARNMIFHRLQGKRRAGSHPATRSDNVLHFHDLTGKELR